MKKLLSAFLIAFVTLSSPTAYGAVKAGSSCAKLGVSAVAGGKKYTCIKSGKKLVWNKGVALPKPAATTSPSATPTPTPSKSYDSLWEKYGWNKPVSAEMVATAATEKFRNYAMTVKNPGVQVKVLAQTGVDETLIKWVQEGADFVAQRFTYPKMSRQFINVIAIDKTWLEQTYTKEGFTTREVQDRIGGFNAGAPAFGGMVTNTWNFATIQRENLMDRNRSGMAQTAGHEFFHAIQENLAKSNPGPNGEKIPNWFWEGPSMFVGTQTTNALGSVTYPVSRQSMIDRYKNGAPINRTSNLEDIRKNDGITDPYAIGFAGSEFLAANVGMEKFINIYAALGTGKDFSTAFKDATGVELSDFYAMFEEVRATLGFAKG